jgi:hypothetical protein
MVHHQRAKGEVLSADAFLLNISLHDDVFLKDIESEPVQLVKK